MATTDAKKLTGSVIALVPKIDTAELLFLSAQKLGLKPHWLSENGLFTIATPQGERYISGAKSSLNSHITIGLARNKFHTRLILERHGLPNIPYARPKSLAEAEAFLRQHGTIIIKPVSGHGSRGIFIVSTLAQLRALDLRGCIAEKYIVGKEMRYLVLNDRVIAVHLSEYGTSVAEDRPLERISFSEPSWDPALSDMALNIATIFSLKFTAIDFLITPEDEIFILEVNTTPGFKWFHAPSVGPEVDVASLFLEAMLLDATD